MKKSELKNIIKEELTRNLKEMEHESSGSEELTLKLNDGVKSLYSAISNIISVMYEMEYDSEIYDNMKGREQAAKNFLARKLKDEVPSESHGELDQMLNTLWDLIGQSAGMQI